MVSKWVIAYLEMGYIGVIAHLLNLDNFDHSSSYLNPILKAKTHPVWSSSIVHFLSFFDITKRLGSQALGDS